MYPVWADSLHKGVLLRVERGLGEVNLNQPSLNPQ